MPMPGGGRVVAGIGVDLVHIPRIQSVLRKFEARFLRRAFHEDEISQYHQLADATQRAQFAASRWAVKEAAFKAFGVSRILFPEIVLEKQGGRPQLRFEGRTQQDLRAAGISGAHVTLSHDHDYATAFVVLERGLDGGGGGNGIDGVAGAPHQEV